jgi:tRNA-Thr(GGU) m(6)t(6)A37 methyltransferase TsaA
MKSLLLLLGVLVATAIAATGDNPQTPAVKPATPPHQFTVVPVGHIQREAGRTFLRLEPRYHDGLLGLDQWSHIWVIYWFDQNDTPAQRATLRVHPRGNPQNPLTGVFATRSPQRPNLIALSLCRVVAIKENVLELASIDAFDQTPVIDIKPYIPGGDVPSGRITVPEWAGR